MKEKFVDAIVNLMKVKSLISIAAVIVFLVLALNGTLDPNTIKEILMLVFVFYFGTQSGKQTAKDEAEAESKATYATSGYMTYEPIKNDENEHFDTVSTTAIGFEIEGNEPDEDEIEPEK